MTTNLLGRFSRIEKSSEEKNEEKNPEPFDFLKRVDPAILYNYIRNEHPQIIALILAHMEPDKASVVLRNFPYEETQSDVFWRIFTMERVNLKITRKICGVLEKKLNAASAEEYYIPGEAESVVRFLDHIGSNSKEKIIKGLEDKDPEFAFEVSRQMSLREPKKGKKT